MAPAERPVQLLSPVVPTPLRARLKVKLESRGSCCFVLCHFANESMSVPVIRKTGRDAASGGVRSSVTGFVQGVPGIHSESLMKTSSTCAAAYTW